jgi:hypothetical protein
MLVWPSISLYVAAQEPLNGFSYKLILTHSLTSIYKCKPNFYFKCYLIIFKFHKMSFKISFVAPCFSLTRPSSGNYQLEEITTLHGLMHQYYHAVTACCRIWEMYGRTSLMLFYVRRLHCVPCAWFFLGQACVPYIYIVMDLINTWLGDGVVNTF